MYVKVVQRDQYIGTQFMQTFLLGNQSCVREQYFVKQFPIFILHDDVRTAYKMNVHNNKSS